MSLLTEKNNLQENDFLLAANALRVTPAVIRGVFEVECPFPAFVTLSNGLVTCRKLFERHWFHSYTKGKYDTRYPAISNRQPGGYGKADHEEYRFNLAAQLDWESAVKATSWNKPQIMGFNYKLAGFTTLQAFYEAMNKNEFQGLIAFVEFIRNRGLDDELRARNAVAFASQYNGKNFRKNNYDVKLIQAWRKWDKYYSTPKA